MNPDTSWEALLKPGEASDFFAALGPAGPCFELRSSRFSPVNAWWLAELSRLIYRKDRDESGSDLLEPTRREILAAAGFDEVARFSRGETYGALVATRDGRGGDDRLSDGCRPRPGPPAAVLVFRGTDSPRDWLTNIKFAQGRDVGGGLVHDGFFDALAGVRKEVAGAVRSLDRPYFCTGHSLGAALATVAAARLSTEGAPPHGVYTFGSPRVGNRAFAKRLARLGLFRVVNRNDCVVRVPPSIATLEYCHAGELHRLDPGGGGGRPSREGSASDGQDSGRSRGALWFKEIFDVRNWFEPPSYLSDHAPVNYVKSLEQAL